MKQEIYEDEIDLRELFLTLKRNLKFIIGFTIFVTSVTIIVVLVKQPIYEVKSNVLVGFIGKENVSKAEEIVKKLKIIFNVDEGIDSEKKFISEVSDITINKKLKNFILIKTNAINNDEALKLNKKVVNYLVNMYKSKIKQYIINQNNNIKVILEDINKINNFEIKNIKEQIKLLKTQKIAQLNEQITFLQKVTLLSINNKIDIYNTKLKEYHKIINSLTNSSANNTDSTVQVFYLMKMLNYQNLILNYETKIEDLTVSKRDINENKIVSLKRNIDNVNSEEIRKLQYKINVEFVNQKRSLKHKINQIRYSISNQNIQNSKVLGNYIVRDNPIKPKKKLIVIISFITAFMLSIFLVFFREFISSFKKEDEEV